MPIRKAKLPAPTQTGSLAWQERAACRTLSVELFLGPEGETPRKRRRREAAAIAVCQSCPVRKECLDHATRMPEWYGVWGGTTEAQRAAERRRRRAA